MDQIQNDILLNSEHQLSVNIRNPTPVRVVSGNPFDTKTHRQCDGRATIQQEYQQLRKNNPDIFAGFGEFLDNAVCWGNAKIVGIFILRGKIYIVDNGRFEDEKTLEISFTKYKDNSMKKYIDPIKEVLGKYNMGLTDSVVILSDNAKIIHNFGDENIKQTKFSVENTQRDNAITPNLSTPSIEEIKDFNHYQKMIDPEYNIENGRGTILEIDNLLKTNTQEMFQEIYRFVYGLYSPKFRNEPVIKLYNWINPNNLDTLPVHVIQPNDLSFGCSSDFSKPFYVYNHPSIEGKKIYQFSPIKDKSPLYVGVIKVFTFDKSSTQKEREVFGNITAENSAGVKISRGGRLITGKSPKQFGFSMGSNHGGGVHLYIELPVCEASDDDFGVGTFKKIIEDSWNHFNEDLKKLIKSEFDKAITNVGASNDKKRDDLEKEYVNKIKQIKISFKTKDETEKEIEKTILRQKNLLMNKDIIKTKSAKANKTIDAYVTHLEAHSKSFDPKPDAPKPLETKPVDTKPVDTKPVDTKPVETKPVETKPVETKPVETKPVDTKPVETKPVETKPVETKPVETKPVETKPVETKPVETKPVETKPVETKPLVPKKLSFTDWLKSLSELDKNKILEKHYNETIKIQF